MGEGMFRTQADDCFDNATLDIDSLCQRKPAVPWRLAGPSAMLLTVAATAYLNTEASVHSSQAGIALCSAFFCGGREGQHGGTFIPLHQWVCLAIKLQVETADGSTWFYLGGTSPPFPSTTHFVDK